MQVISQDHCSVTGSLVRSLKQKRFGNMKYIFTIYMQLTLSVLGDFSVESMHVEFKNAQHICTQYAQCSIRHTESNTTKRPKKGTSIESRGFHFCTDWPIDAYRYIDFQESSLIFSPIATSLLHHASCCRRKNALALWPSQAVGPVLGGSPQGGFKHVRFYKVL